MTRECCENMLEIASEAKEATAFRRPFFDYV